MCSETLKFNRPIRDLQVCLLPRPAELAERLREQDQIGYERGWLEGQKQLNEQLMRQRAELLEAHEGVLSALGRCVPAMAREGEKALVALALEVAGKLVASLPINSEMMEAAVLEALAELEQNGEFVVLLHPEDLALLQRANSNVLAAKAGEQRAEFRSVPGVARGGCMVQTRFGVIDGSRETKMELLKTSILAQCP